MAGHGFTFSVPTGWVDVTSQARHLQSSVDVAVAVPPTSAFRDNFNIVTPNPLNGATRSQLVAEAAKELGRVTHTKVVSLPSRGFDGETAIGQMSQASAGGYSVTLVQYLIPHGPLVYATTMTFDTHDRSKVLPALQQIMHSWSWTG